MQATAELPNNQQIKKDAVPEVRPKAPPSPPPLFPPPLTPPDLSPISAGVKSRDSTAKVSTFLDYMATRRSAVSTTVAAAAKSGAAPASAPVVVSSNNDAAKSDAAPASERSPASRPAVSPLHSSPRARAGSKAADALPFLRLSPSSASAPHARLWVRRRSSIDALPPPAIPAVASPSPATPVAAPASSPFAIKAGAG